MDTTKTLAIFDIDGTLFRGFTQKLFFKILRENKEISWLNVLKLNSLYIIYKLGFIKDPAWLRKKAYESIIGISREKLFGYIENNFQFFSERIPAESIELVNKHKVSGDEILALSASSEPIVKEICKYLGINNYICTVLEFVDETFTGNFISPPPYGENKNIQLDSFFSKKGPFFKTYHYADHISDLCSLEKVDIPVCVNPCKKLKKIAMERKWKVIQWQ